MQLLKSVTVGGAEPFNKIQRDKSSSIVPPRDMLSTEQGNFPFLSGLINESVETHPWRKPKRSVPDVARKRGSLAAGVNNPKKKFYDLEGMFVPSTAEINENDY